MGRNRLRGRLSGEPDAHNVGNCDRKAAAARSAAAYDPAHRLWRRAGSVSGDIAALGPSVLDHERAPSTTNGLQGPATLRSRARTLPRRAINRRVHPRSLRKLWAEGSSALRLQSLKITMFPAKVPPLRPSPAHPRRVNGPPVVSHIRIIRLIRANELHLLHRKLAVAGVGRLP